ncbi:hypothetical protein ACFSQJ_06335 [Croceitalea marina]|uniref:Uncharacterized protein n=1 Tax=Croceitalea marina TaxID=1775166 RepID=A0ABW5MY19_9FLAO
MNHKRKYLYKVLFCCLLILFLTNCEKDINFTEDATTILKEYPNVSYFSNIADVPQVASALNNTLNKYVSIDSKKDESTYSYETSFGTIHNDRIMQSISDEGVVNYTFRVTIKDDDPTTFYNLILRKETDGSFAPPYLKKITMSPGFYEAYSKGTKNLNEFEGSYNNYEINENLDITVLLGTDTTEKGGLSGPCPVPVESNGDGNTPNPNDGNNSNGGTSSGGGGTSGTGTGTGSNGSSNSSQGVPVSCTSRIVANECNGGGGHLGEEPSCTGSFKGSLQLVTTCTNGDVDVEELKRNVTVGAKGSDCPQDSGDVGMLDESTPLKELRKLLTDTKFKIALNNIKSHLNSNIEHGYEVSKAPDALQVSTNFKTGTENNVKLATGGNIIGGIHHHTQSKGHPMFSAHDIRMLLLYYSRNINRRRTVGKNHVFTVMLSQHGIFALKINDLIALSKLVDEKGFNALNKSLEDKYDNTTIPETKSKYTDALLNALKDVQEDKNITVDAIQLYELNQDETDWNLITLD